MLQPFLRSMMEAPSRVPAGGPNYPGLSVPVGESDILISMVYKIAIDSGTPNYGLASAMSIVIFIVVGVIAWLGFRQTKTLEEL